MIAALSILEPWLLEQQALPQNDNTERHLKRALMSTLLVVEPHDYIYDDFTFVAATMKLLQRVLDFNSLITNTMANFPVLPLPKEQTSDLFGSDTEDKIWAVTASGSKPSYVGDANDWSYNSILNGNLHPATREPILRFEYFNLNAFNNLSCIFKLSRIEFNKLRYDLSLENNALKCSDLDSIIDFEDYYDIPEERRYSNIHIQEIQRDHLIFEFLAELAAQN